MRYLNLFKKARASSGLRQVLDELRREGDRLQFRQLRFLHRRQVALLEDLIVRLDGAEHIQEPPLVGQVALVNAMVHDLLVLADLVELLEQDVDCGWTRAGQHLHLGELWAEGLLIDHVVHVLLGDHGALELGQVVAAAQHGLVEVAAVLHQLREVVDRELDRR